ncbi:MAG: GNAT family N-acetyltransferase [Bryobacterales bacterium]|nr:GNAT family N-acetyltransferase [Bryobacterales bacterium]
MKTRYSDHMTGGVPTFRFLDPGPLVDADLALRLVKTTARRQDTEDVATYHFEMLTSGALAGDIRFRAESDFDVETWIGHIGYRVAPAFRGRRFAERSCRLLLPLAAAHGFTALWITCDIDNQPSRRTCERLGAVLVDIAAPPAGYVQSKCRYRLTLSDPHAHELLEPPAPCA